MDNRIIDASNQIYRKEYDIAIKALNCIEDDSLTKMDRAMKHLNLAIAHFKKKEIDLSNVHYYKAIANDHPTGYAHEHLAINLTKQGKLEEAIAVCRHALSHPTIPHESYLSKEDFQKRLVRLGKAMEKKKNKEI